MAASGESARASFAAFVEARAPRLLRTAWLLTGDAVAAEDLLQSALARTWPHWPALAAGGEAEAYVRRAMVNTQISWWRRRWRGEVPTAEPPERPSTSDAYAAVDDRAALGAALRTLPPRQRAVVVLRYYEDLSEAQVAATLGCSVGTVKSQNAKALARLRPLIGPDGEAPAASGTTTESKGTLR